MLNFTLASAALIIEKPRIHTMFTGLLFLLAALICPSVSANDQGSQLFKRPSATLPALPEYQPAPEQAPLLAPEKQTPMPEPQASGPRFKLKGIVIKGNQAISNEELNAAVQDYIGQSVSLADLETIRLKLTQVYKDQGYTTSGATLPDQHISDGYVEFQIIEGKLEKINIENAERLQHSYITDRLLINTDGPLNLAQLQKNFQLLLSDPLIERLNGVLKPGSEPGQTILDLDVTRNPQPYGLYVGFDNQTPPSIGAYTGRIGGFIRNLTGYGDVVGLNIDISSGLRSLDFNFSVPLNGYETRFLFDFQTSYAEIVESPLDRLDIESDFYHVEVGLSQPIYNDLNRKFILDARYAYRENKTTLLGQPFPFAEGADQNGRSAVSVLRLVQNFIDRGQYHALSLRSIFNIGFQAFDASKSDIFPDSRFFSWIGQANYAHRLDDRGTEVVLRGAVQLSDAALLPLERIAIGGFSTVRGYRENYRVKDEGYFVALELRYPLLNPADFSGNSLEIVPFFDVGAAWNHNEDDVETLYSAGIGLKWGWKRFNAQFFWAHAFTARDPQTEYDLQDDGIYFQISSRVF